jgi:3-phosphoshikimate 1-carboxyvinyltransferase
MRVNRLSEDILATARCLEAMGCKISIRNSQNGKSSAADDPFTSLDIEPMLNHRPASVSLDCGESGSTARFLLPLVTHLYKNFSMTGTGRLPGRPFAPLCDALATAGGSFSGSTLPMTGAGPLRAGAFSLPGNISSQFISGLLFVLPLLDGESRIRLTTPLESAAYVDMTREALRLFQINVMNDASGFVIPGNQRYITPGNAAAEGDWSNAAFFLCMGALNGDISMRGLSMGSSQGDKAVIEILRRYGAQVEIGESDSHSVINVSTQNLRGIEIDASQIPDLVPVLAVAAAAAQGETRIFNAGRLRMKESDRIQSTYDLITALGGDARITEDGLVIRGKEKLAGGTVHSANDHRIVMAAATAACVCRGPVVIRGWEAVNKSYPTFFEDLAKMGGKMGTLR